MQINSNSAHGLGRILSLVLFLAAGASAWAQVDQPLANQSASWPFTQTGDGSLGLIVTEYACADNLHVTLIPTLHFAEPSFYEAVDRLEGAADHVIYEGVRPAGFFGAPFEDDPRPGAPTDPRQVTQLRLRYLFNAIEIFRAAHDRDPRTLGEVYQSNVTPAAAEAFARTILVDAWGTPLELKTRASGQLVILSRGADRLPGGGDDFGLPLPPFDANAPKSPSAAPNELARGIEDYQRRGRQLGLALQNEYPFTSQWRPNSLNADISQDMLEDYSDLRMTLPIAALNRVARPARVALVYGAAHAVDLQQRLAGPALRCRPSHRETLVAIASGGVNASLRATTIAEILSAATSTK